MMITRTALTCLWLTAAQAFVPSSSTTRRAPTTELDMFSVDFTIPSLPLKLPPLPDVMVDCGLPVECSLPEECPFPIESPFPEECPPVVEECAIAEGIFDSPLCRLSLLLFGEGDIVQEEVENGMTNAMIDIGSFWNDNVVFIRALSVVFRLVILCQDLVPGHHVLPDELAFQVGFLGLACNSLYRTVVPKIEAKRASLFMTGKDRLAFRSIFRSAGFSWLQFRELHLQSMNWVTLEAGEVILNEAQEDEDDAVFWLYQGDVQIQNSEKQIMHSISSKDETRKGMDVIGEKRLAALLLDGGSNRQQIFDEQATRAKSYVAGDSGATLLRMDMPKLRDFVRHNENMTSNFGSLAFKAMQDKLKALRMETN